MLNNISKLKGIYVLKTEEQKLVNGENGGCYACFCHHTNTNPNCCCVN